MEYARPKQSITTAEPLLKGVAHRSEDNATNGVDEEDQIQRPSTGGRVRPNAFESIFHLPVAPQYRRQSLVLNALTIQWENEGAARRINSDGSSVPLSFEEVCSKVHANDLADVKFDFSLMNAREKERLLMRACPLSAVTSNFGQQFASASSGDDEFKLSRPVAVCDDFLSHAWKTDRMLKWQALAYNYNLRTSSIVWVVLHVLGMICCQAIRPDNPRTLSYEITVVVMVVYIPMIAQLYTLAYGMQLRSLLGVTLPDVFLDKLCINQTHVGLKQLGISGLETFLRHSKRMVLLYDEFTYTRLWCAFESAMFAR